MTKLSGLIIGMAAALRMPEKTVSYTASVLRKHKLLTTGPRGPGAPEMTPTDCTNLLLALMYDEAVEDAPLNVPRLRAAKFYGSSTGPNSRDGKAGDLTPHPFLADEAGPRTFGDMLDHMFDEAARYGTFEDEFEDGTLGIYVTNLSITVSRPGLAASLYLDTHWGLWHFNYKWSDPEDAARRADEAARGEMPAHPLAHLRPYMSSERSISDDSFWPIVNCLRGRPMDEDEVGARVPYQWDRSTWADQAKGAQCPAS